MNWDAGAWPLAPPVATGTGAILMMVGLTMPMWGAGIATMRTRRHARARLAEMAPLWDDLRTITPAIALPVGGNSTLGIEVLLYRRMIEIRDGLLEISAHLPTDLHPNDPADPHRTAARIHAAITAIRADHCPTATKDDHQLVTEARDDVAAWLAAVSSAYAGLTGAGCSGSRLLARA